ncbi:hypothetical protein AWZ03_001472 [Drosophila navojoa]|uniref:Uncharacterized protein n=1 Tax=Drosophila navojoa TaxID=7232 RepID=A0A484BWP3_DRONA|nr:uncharacterized protein LOC108659518 [Drosophila navojoa]TDG52191.1 hypothetical protein AWZ03_001472 [Drosophila navojoa]
MKRCYCGYSGGSSILKPTRHVDKLQQRQPLRSDRLSVTSSSRQSAYPTQFVKRPSLKRTVEPLGLGHSKSELARNFSRRNSAATTLSHCSSWCSSCGCAPQQKQRENRVKVLSWDTGDHQGNTSSGHNNTNNTHCEHTYNRRLYEQRACAVSRVATEGQGQVHSSMSATPSPTPNCTTSENTELQRLLQLQQFRLLNASECFSDQRQDELRLQQAYDKLGVAHNAKREKNKANECRQQNMMATTTTATCTTPYALRQKLLQLRLREEQATGRGSGAMCAPLEKSCALKYNRVD